MITASIVTYHHTPQEITKVIECVVNSSVEKIYIIDNTNNDQLRELEKLSPKIRYIHNENIGYGGAHNIAMREAIELDSDYHIVINPDIYFETGVIESLAEYMDNNLDVGLVMPKVLYPTGEIQYLCKLLPTPMDLIVRRFMPFKAMKEKLDSRYELRALDYDAISEIPSLSGCFMFLRCSTLKEVGLFDNRFFMYAEDLDLCRRIGMVSKTVFNPIVSVYHAYEKGSYKRGKLLKYHITSVVKYFNKWGWFYDAYRKKQNRKILNPLS